MIPSEIIQEKVDVLISQSKSKPKNWYIEIESRVKAIEEYLDEKAASEEPK